MKKRKEVSSHSKGRIKAVKKKKEEKKDSDYCFFDDFFVKKE